MRVYPSAVQGCTSFIVLAVRVPTLSFHAPEGFRQSIILVSMPDACSRRGLAGDAGDGDGEQRATHALTQAWYATGGFDGQSAMHADSDPPGHPDGGPGPGVGGAGPGPGVGGVGVGGAGPGVGGAGPGPGGSSVRLI